MEPRRPRGVLKSRPTAGDGFPPVVVVSQSIFDMDVTVTHQPEADDHAMHDMDEADFALHVALEAGNSAEFSFVPHEAGEFTIVCNEPGHAEAGMAGTLIVTMP